MDLNINLNITISLDEDTRALLGILKDMPVPESKAGGGSESNHYDGNVGEIVPLAMDAPVEAPAKDSKSDTKPGADRYCANRPDGCANTIAPSSKTGLCRSCAMKRAIANNPEWKAKLVENARKNRRSESEPAESDAEVKLCGDCNAELHKSNKTGYCRSCGLTRRNTNPDHPWRVKNREMPNGKDCPHERNPDTCPMCADMRERGIEPGRSRDALGAARVLDDLDAVPEELADAILGR